MPAPPVFPAVLPVAAALPVVKVWAIQIGAVTNTVSQPESATVTSSERASVKTGVT